MVSLEYLAGFFDGEGCITLCDGKRKYNLKCICGNTVKESVELFQERFGGKVYLQDRPFNKPNWKVLWKWVVTDSLADAFIREILPYLRIKRAVAELALEFRAIPLKPKGNFKSGDYRLIVKAEIQSKRDTVVNRLRSLNFRGRFLRQPSGTPKAEILPEVYPAKES